MLKVDFDIQISGALKKALETAGNKPLDRTTMNKVGETVVKEMKEMIASGISPIEGKGKFPRYKDPKKYPGSKKSKSPVDLRLKGDFLESLTHDEKPASFGYNTEIHYSQKEEIKERGHRAGANGQPSRPTLPTRSGEDFAVRIRQKFISIMRERIFDVLKGRG